MRVFAFLFCLMAIHFSSFSDEALQYLSITEGKKNETTWHVEKKEDSIIAKAKSSMQDETSLQLSSDYTLHKIEQINPNKAQTFSAYRDKDILIASSTLKTSNKNKTHKIGQRSWVQEFTFGFKDFLTSSDREYKFEILHPQNLDMHDMIAIKQYEEELTIDGASYHAIKMKITLQGFKGKFWKAEAWYDTKTHQLLRYKANEGPGTPVTETLFLGATKEKL